MRFHIVHPDGRQYELTDVAYFQREYAPQGFVIDQNPPNGYDVPDLTPKKAAKVEAPKDEGKAT